MYPKQGLKSNKKAHNQGAMDHFCDVAAWPLRLVVQEIEDRKNLPGIHADIRQISQSLHAGSTLWALSPG